MKRLLVVFAFLLIIGCGSVAEAGHTRTRWGLFRPRVAVRRSVHVVRRAPLLRPILRPLIVERSVVRQRSLCVGGVCRPH